MRKEGNEMVMRNERRRQSEREQAEREQAERELAERNSALFYGGLGVVTAIGKIWLEGRRQKEQEDEEKRKRELERKRKLEDDERKQRELEIRRRQEEKQQEEKYRLPGFICAVVLSFVGMLFYATAINFWPNSWWDNVVFLLIMLALLPSISDLCTNYVIKCSKYINVRP